MSKEVIKGLTNVQAQFKLLKEKAKGARGSGEVVGIVGYTQDYAVYVHEDLTATHKEGKQAKFLEEPFRTNQPIINKLIADTYKETGDLELAIMTGALRLLRESQMVVPVDTGALRASGFAALEKDAPKAAQAALTASKAFK